METVAILTLSMIEKWDLFVLPYDSKKNWGHPNLPFLAIKKLQNKSHHSLGKAVVLVCLEPWTMVSCICRLSYFALLLS
jgi:hypothetical protein